MTWRERGITGSYIRYQVPHHHEHHITLKGISLEIDVVDGEHGCRVHWYPSHYSIPYLFWFHVTRTIPVRDREIGCSERVTANTYLHGMRSCSSSRSVGGLLLEYSHSYAMGYLLDTLTI